MMLWACCLVLSLSLLTVDGAKNYADALGKSILFYDAQRSGKLPANNPIHWRGDSALNDCVPGGWYDAGDHVKFGLPLSSTLTVLGWSLNKFKDGYVRAGQLDNAYDSVKWGYDYLLKAWNPSKNELVAQVGDGDLDHAFWGRPEDMTMARPCKVVNANNLGSDIAAGTASALAVGSIVFKDKGDSAYASQLLDAAKGVYTLAKNHRGVFVSAFYGGLNDTDELCESAMWLYKATHDAAYLKDAKSFGDDSYSWGFGWENKMVACQALLYEVTGDNYYRAAVDNYFTYNWFPGTIGSIAYTPCGLAWRDKWGSLRAAANSAYIALIAAELGIQTTKLRQWAAEQINYILGDNKHDGGCYSFEIGYGSKYPLRPHHRGASCPNRPAPCGYDEANSPNPSPQILYGGLVGGPDEDDSYEDVRTDYVENEVALDYNAGFQGSLAGILHLQATNQLPATNNKCPCNN
jgi:endoglucanase